MVLGSVDSDSLSEENPGRKFYPTFDFILLKVYLASTFVLLLDTWLIVHFRLFPDIGRSMDWLSLASCHTPLKACAIGHHLPCQEASSPSAWLCAVK